MASYSATRWWSKWEVIKEVMVYFADIEPFLRENEDIGIHLRPKLLAFFDNPQTTPKLCVKIAATVDWGEPFVKACYTLEGDGGLSLECFEIVDRIKAAVAVENIPKVQGVAHLLTRQPPQHPHHKQWVNYARSCVKKGLDYFETKLSTNLKNALEVFKVCRLFLPRKVKEMQLNSLTLYKDLSCLPFLDKTEQD